MNEIFKATKSFAGPVIDAIWGEAQRTGKGTAWVNTHPIITLFLDKLASLNRSQSLVTMEKFSHACNAVSAIITPHELHVDGALEDGTLTGANGEDDKSVYRSLLRFRRHHAAECRRTIPQLRRSRKEPDRNQGGSPSRASYNH